MTRVTQPVTDVGIRALVTDLRRLLTVSQDPALCARLEEAAGTLEYLHQSSHTFESVLRAEEGVLFEDGYQVNVAALIDGLKQVQRSDTTPGAPFAGIARAALQLSGGAYEYPDDPAYSHQYTAETCPGRPCAPGCDHRGTPP
jgi:hypothetical protein